MTTLLQEKSASIGVSFVAECEDALLKQERRPSLLLPKPTRSKTAARRGELKYLLSEEEYDAFRFATEAYLEPDRFSYTEVRSCYLDTKHNDMIRRSIEKPSYKEKLRIRTYEAHPTPDSGCFLEIKRKVQGTVYKRRVAMSVKEVQDYVEKRSYPLKTLASLTLEKREESLRVLKELDCIFEKYQALNPSFIVACNRLSLKERLTESLRITFDHDLRWLYERDAVANGGQMQQLIDKGARIMEIKSTTGLPFWLVGILNEQKIYPRSFSKVGNSYKAWLHK